MLGAITCWIKKKRRNNILSVFGLCGIPADCQLRQVPTDKGYYLNFFVSAQDAQNVDKYHKYYSSMWVPKDSIEKWLADIQPNNIFFIGNAKWAMKEMKKEDGTVFNVPQLVLNFQEFKKLKIPHWFEKKVQDAK